MNPDEMELNVFWKIYITITVLVSVVAFTSLNVKKMVEKFKEFKIRQGVTVMPIDSNEAEVQLVQSNKTYTLNYFKFNNSKYNDPMFTGRQMACWATISFGLILGVIVFRDFNEHVNPHQVFIYHTVIIEPIFIKMTIPTIYLAVRKDVRRFMCQEIMSLRIFENVDIPDWKNVRLFKHRACSPITEIELEQTNTDRNTNGNKDEYPVEEADGHTGNET